MHIHRQEIVDYARSWLGIPFKFYGRSRDGVDCGGLIVMLAKKFCEDFKEENMTYSKQPQFFNIKKELNKYLDKVKEINLGDIVLFGFPRPDQHLAIVANYKYGGFSIIHAVERPGKVCEHRLVKVWEKRIIQAYKFPGVVDE